MAQIQRLKIPGLSLAVIRDGQIIKAQGYGFANLELQVPATADTVYEIGSISKQFAAEAVMLLVQDGRLKLDAPINDYLPANAPDTWKTVTVRNLLNQVSGLKDFTQIDSFSYRREYTPEEFIELVRPFPLQFSPNETWAYSNTNLPLIGIIVETASGLSYQDFVREHIFKSLGLSSIRFHANDEIVAERASGYVLKDNVLCRGEPLRPKIIAPSGGVLANVSDLAKWWEAVLQGRVVKPESLETMLLPVKLNDGSQVSHGFAFFTDTFNGHKMIFHHGSTVGGFGGVVRYFPHEKLTIAILGNLEDGGFGAEYMSKRIANFYIPGSFVGGLEEGDAKANGIETKKFLQILRDIADTKESEMLTSSFAQRISDDFRKQIGKHLANMESFSFLGSEKIGPDHFVLDKTLTDIVYFKMKTGGRIVYYQFRIDRDGKIGFITAEED